MDSENGRMGDRLEMTDPGLTESTTYEKLIHFEEKFRESAIKQTFTSKLRNAVSKRKSAFFTKYFYLNHFPIVKTIVNYNVREDLANDMIAGLTAGVMMIPQGMAFAALSTLPPIVGLYISFFASITYAILGTGRQLSWGCIAILSLMFASILDKYDAKISGIDGSTCTTSTYGSEPGNDSFITYNLSEISTVHTPVDSGISDVLMSKRLEVASAVSIVSGIILLIASQIGLHKITSLMSNSLITGFTVGISFHVVTSQIKGVFGLNVSRTTGFASIVKTWIQIIMKIPDTNVATLIISLISMLIIYLVKRFVNERYKKKLRIPIPVELFVVIIATVISSSTHLHQRFQVKVIKEVPMGIPSPKFPDLRLATDYIGDGIIIIVIAYAQTLAMAKTMGLKHKYVVDSNQEMLACGVVSVVCGLFSGYISASSVSRTVVQDGAGGKTQVASLFASLMVLLVIVVLGQYFYYLPTCVLSSIIIVNLRTMFLKLFTLPKEWRESPYDCAIWLFACFSTVILNADMGLLSSIIFSLLLVILRSMISPVVEAGKIQTSTLSSELRSVDKYSSLKTFDNVKILRIKTPLYYANADTFVSKVFSKTGINPTSLKKEKEAVNGSLEISVTNTNHNNDGIGATTNGDPEVAVKMIDSCIDADSKISQTTCNHVVLDVSEVSFVDLMGIQALQFVIKEFSSVGVTVLLTNVSENVILMMQSSGFWKKHGDSLFLTVDSALASIQ